MKNNFVKNVTIINIIITIALFALFVFLSLNNKYLHGFDEVVANSITMMAVFYLPLYIVEVIFFLWKKPNYIKSYGNSWKYPLYVTPIAVLASTVYLATYLLLMIFIILFSLRNLNIPLSSSFWINLNLFHQIIPLVVALSLLFVLLRKLMTLISRDAKCRSSFNE
ncbi:MAG: hypothetical protein PHW75_02275 [Patescibacteria group bacterium]|nr:hypothetical protein [Patescibacteria group bacterium]